MKIKTIKIPIMEMTDDKTIGLTFFRIWADRNYSEEDLLDKVGIQIGEKARPYGEGEVVFKKLRECPILFFSKRELTIDDGLTNKVGYDYHMLVDTSAITSSLGGSMYRWFNRRGLGRKLYFNDGLVGFMSELLSDGSSLTELFVDELGVNILSYFENTEDFINNLTLVGNVLSDPNKIYNNNSSIKLELNIYANMKEALQSKELNTYFITQGDFRLGTLLFKQFQFNPRGGTILGTVYKNKIYMDIVNNKVVFYDGEKAFNTIKPYIEKLPSNIQIIDVLQYSLNKDLYFQKKESFNNEQSFNKVVFKFARKDMIDPRLGRLNVTPNGVSIPVMLTLNNKKAKKMPLDIRITSAKNYIGTVLIPVTLEGPNIEAIKDSVKLLNIVNVLREGIEDVDNDIYRNIASKYYNSLTNTVTSEEGDVLSNWFKCCTATSVSDDRHIINAYKDMKKKLLKEYKELEEYVNYYNLGKYTPIPTIKMDKKLTENYYKSLQIEPRRVKINNINQRKINSIDTVKTYLTFMTNYHNSMIMGQYDILDFYNKTDNSIDLNYIKLKGVVVNDKTKNWR